MIGWVHIKRSASERVLASRTRGWHHEQRNDKRESRHDVDPMLCERLVGDAGPGHSLRLGEKKASVSFGASVSFVKFVVQFFFFLLLGRWTFSVRHGDIFFFLGGGWPT